MSLGRRITRNPAFQRLLGEAMAGYLSLVRWTSPLRSEPANLGEAIAPLSPAIIAMWHGQHFMMPFSRPRGFPVAVMISRHHEAEINALAAERLGLKTVRASGSHVMGSHLRKGGMAGFREMMRHLEEGTTVALTADVPKVHRVVGKGIVTLAKHSGRPIVPVAFATSRRRDLDSWDKASLNLPFGRSGLVMGAPIRVAADASEEDLDAARAAVRAGLDAATRRAYELAGSTWRLARDERDG